MTRTLAAGLVTHIATRTTKLARCARLDLRDGTTIAVTDHDRDLAIDLGDGSATYLANTGLALGAISLEIGFNPSLTEIRGPIGDVVTLLAVLGGRFNRARVRVFDYRWDTSGQLARYMAGRVTEPRVEGGAFVLEVRGSGDAYNQAVGRVLSPYCSHDLGDAKCQVDMTARTYAATVATVTDDLSFTVTFGAPPSDQALLTMGKATFLTGALAGTPPIEVFSCVAGAVTLFQPAAAAPQVGDTLEIEEGCDKLRSTCVTRFAAGRRFGGFPDAPGSSQYLKYAVPGSSA